MLWRHYELRLTKDKPDVATPRSSLTSACHPWRLHGTGWSPVGPSAAALGHHGSCGPLERGHTMVFHPFLATQYTCMIHLCHYIGSNDLNHAKCAIHVNRRGMDSVGRRPYINRSLLMVPAAHKSCVPGLVNTLIQLKLNWYVMRVISH